jgi:hypothetical protein
MRKDLAGKRTKDGYKYILGPHTGPNRAIRRKAAQIQQRQLRRVETWKRQLLAVGINPEDVLAARRARLERNRPAAGGDGHAGRGGAGQNQVPG